MLPYQIRGFRCNAFFLVACVGLITEPLMFLSSLRCWCREMRYTGVRWIALPTIFFFLGRGFLLSSVLPIACSVTTQEQNHFCRFHFTFWGTLAACAAKRLGAALYFEWFSGPEICMCVRVCVSVYVLIPCPSPFLLLLVRRRRELRGLLLFFFFFYQRATSCHGNVEPSS